MKKIINIVSKHFPKASAIYSIIILSLIMSVMLSCGKTQNKDEIRVSEILNSMTLEEKVGQMAQITLDVIGKGDSVYTSYEPFEIDTAKLAKAIVDYKVGSVLNSSNNRALPVELWNKIITTIQDFSINRTRLKIPVIYGIDAIHGSHYTAEATVFPQQIGLAATWNEELVRETAKITAYETRASNISWNFAPVLDLGSDPRFPRQFEGFGEDPYLCSRLGVAMIEGYEGDSVSDVTKVAACAKHYMGYSVPNSGKDRTPAFIPESTLREYHLPAFKAAVEAGIRTFMVNSGIINGISVHSSHYIITDVLKKELGFMGVVVTDWNDIDNLYRRDLIAANEKEAIKIAINAGIDMSMIPYKYESFCKNLVELVNEGEVEESRIDDAVRRILKLKIELGLFEKPNTYVKDYPEFGSVKYAKVSYDAASESITLLKNTDDILPLKKSRKILVTGPNANTLRPLNGGWSYSWQGDKVDEFTTKFNTIYEAIRDKFGETNVTLVPGVSYVMEGKYYEEKEERYSEALTKAKNSDLIILCLGENSYTEKPGDLNDLYLSDLQTKLAMDMAKSGKPVILVLNEGRPRVISKIEPLMSAIIQLYLPGNFGGDALADMLTGDVNPSGRLPYTYPAYPNSLVPYYHKPSEEQTPVPGVYNYESDFNPQYIFGYGLSYTTFEYSNLKMNKTDMKTLNDSITISVDVTNKGKVKGKEVVQLYTSDLVASVTPDVKRLRKFKKIELDAGETKKVELTIKPHDLSFVNQENKWTIEPGVFVVSINNLKKEFSIK